MVQMTHSLVESVQVRSMSILTFVSARDSAHNFSVKISPSMCIALEASLTGEMAAKSFAYHTHGTANGDKSCCYPWLVCHEISNALLAQGPLNDDNSSDLPWSSCRWATFTLMPLFVDHKVGFISIRMNKTIITHINRWLDSGLSNRLSLWVMWAS